MSSSFKKWGNAAITAILYILVGVLFIADGILALGGRK